MVDSSNNKTVAMKGAYFYGERRDSFSREEVVGKFLYDTQPSIPCCASTWVYTGGGREEAGKD
jgi:hypothetical protein